MIRDRFSRTAILFGDVACEKIFAAHAVICGVGAVGSFAAEALARSCVGRFDLWDFDSVEESNVNRQLCALSSTIGRLKIDVVKERILDINPSAKVDLHPAFIDSENAAQVVGAPENGKVVVDAIDSIPSKAALIFRAAEAGVAIVSSMGAARRSDPSRIKQADIMKTYGCPVAARVRKLLRSLGYSGNCECVFSDESVSESTHVPSQNEKIIGSCAVVAGIFGLRLANLAIAEILPKK